MKRTFGGDTFRCFLTTKPGSDRRELQGNGRRRWNFVRGRAPINHESRSEKDWSLNILREGLHWGLHGSQVSFCPPEHRYRKVISRRSRRTKEGHLKWEFTSSSRNTGLFTPVAFTPWISRPGILRCGVGYSCMHHSSRMEAGRQGSDRSKQGRLWMWVRYFIW